MLVDDSIERESATDSLDDLELFFVKRIADQVATGRRRVRHEGVVVKRLDGVGVREAGGNDFATTGVARHKMWFY